MNDKLAITMLYAAGCAAIVTALYLEHGVAIALMWGGIAAIVPACALGGRSMVASVLADRRQRP